MAEAIIIFSGECTDKNLDFVQYSYMSIKNERQTGNCQTRFRQTGSDGRVLTQNPARLKPHVGELALSQSKGFRPPAPHFKIPLTLWQFLFSALSEP